MLKTKNQPTFLPRVQLNLQNNFNNKHPPPTLVDKRDKNQLQRQPRIEITPTKSGGVAALNGNMSAERLRLSEGNIGAASTTTETSNSMNECNLSWEDENDPEEIATREELISLANFNRQKWGRRSEFLMILMGYTIGLGNVWRFPYLCQKNGGASFLIPYCFFMLVEGMPLYYMELCIGQRFRRGSVGVWHTVSPYLNGIGVASAIICLLVCLYYNVILSWCLVYFVNSFKNPLPWSACPKEKVSVKNQTILQTNRECELAGPTRYFWYRMTLDISDNMEEGFGINQDVALSLLVAWAVCWLCMIRGIRSEGKVVFVTATVPLLLLGVMFFRGVHLKGFQQGLALLFVPKFEMLKKPSVWLEAASQTFYSLGVAYGTLIAFSSYNPLKNDTTRDALLLCSIDAGVSVYASIVIFCFIGYRAQVKFEECLHNIGAFNHTDYGEFTEYFLTDNAVYSSLVATVNGTIRKTCEKQEFLHELSYSTGFAFVTFTEAINYLPHSRLWAILFFLMLLMLGIDTQFGMLEGFVTPLLEMKYLPQMRREISTGIICCVMYILSLTMVMYSGNYWLQVIENYSSGIPLLVVALAEVLSISYIYGLEKFSEDIEYMTSKRPHKVWLYCWKFISPFLLIVVLLFSVRNLFVSEHAYQVWDREQADLFSKPFPPWAVFIGLLAMFTSIVCIPLFALLRYYRILDDAKDRLRLYFSEKNKKALHMSKYELPNDQHNGFDTTEL